MKKILFISIIVILFTGCNKQEKYEEAMKFNAVSFYNEYQKNQTGLTNPTISIKQLKDANQYVNANFDLIKLKKCSDESYVELIINQNNGEIIDTKFYMNCE